MASEQSNNDPAVLAPSGDGRQVLCRVAFSAAFAVLDEIEKVRETPLALFVDAQGRPFYNLGTGCFKGQAASSRGQCSQNLGSSRNSSHEDRASPHGP